VIETPWFMAGMLRGAFGVASGGPMQWDFEFEWDPEGWEPPYTRLPAWRSIGPGWEFTVPTWVVFLVVVVLTVIAFRLSAVPEGCCLKCGYDLTGNVSGRCPECGGAIGGERIEG
jgi:hypothetical protein